MMRLKTVLASILIALAWLVLMPTKSFAQLAGAGNITGTVSDASGGIVPETKIIVTNTGTGVANNIASDSQGKYTMPNLAVGTYSVTAQKEGFQSITKTGVDVSVGRTTVVDIALSVGQVSQQVQVAAEAPVVETQDSSVGMLVDSQEVKDLPLNGRSYIQMATYSPGVVAIPNNTVGGFGEGIPMRLAVNGARQEGELFLVDGTNTNGLWGSSGGSQLAGTSLGVDAISEFQILTNTYGAQYSGNGTVVNAAIRTGTNTFHGSVFDFERNAALDAWNLFDNRLPGGQPPFYRHQYGASLGGPVKKDKAFFYGNYEGIRQSLGVTPAAANYPDANARQGILPCYQAVGIAEIGGGTCTATSGGMANVAAAFPASFAVIKPVLLTYPFPNGAELNAANTTCPAAQNCPSGAAAYQVALQQPTLENYWVGKFDYNFSDKDSFSLTYILDRSYLLQPNFIDSLGIVNRQMSNQVTMTENRILSPTKTNTARFSYYLPEISSTPQNTPTLVIQPGHLGGGWGVTGSNWSGIGGGGIVYSHINNWAGSDQIYWTTGKHAIQFGAQITRTEQNINFPLSLQGSYTFASDLAFFQNIPQTFSGPPPQYSDAMRGFRYTGFAPYFQDQYQITKRLTLTLGVRYDFITNPTEVQNKLTAITNLASSTFFTPVAHAYYTNPTSRDVAPRIGFAWDVFGDRKTSVRGGFGMFYDGIVPIYLSGGYSTTPPYFSETVSGPPPFPANPFSGTGLALPTSGQGNCYGSPTSCGRQPEPYMMQYNLNIQRQLFANTVLNVGYVGTGGRHLYIKSPSNTCQPTSIAPDGYYIRNYTFANASKGICGPFFPNPNFFAISLSNAIGDSNYNALQASLIHNFGKGIEFQAAYTWSRCLSFADAFTGGESVNIGSKGGGAGGTYAGQAVSSLGNTDYGPCDFNLTNLFSSNVLYALPFHGNRLFEGWTTSLIATAHSGFLTTPIVGVDQANCGQNQCSGIVRPDLVAGCDPNAGPKTAQEWYNPFCFAEPALGMFGNAGRNIIKNPGFWNFDFSISKDTKITESTKIELRAEFFNVFNHPNLGFPAFSLFTNSTGAQNAVAFPVGGNPANQIQDTAGYTSRQLQFGAKFIF